MLDVGWTEILVIAIVLIIVVGPKDLPQMLRTFGRMMSKMRGMASDFRQQFDEALREADLEDVKKTIGEAQKLNPLNTTRDVVNPLRQMSDELKSDLRRATGAVTTPTLSPNPVERLSAAPVKAPSASKKPGSAEPVAVAPLKAQPVPKKAKKEADGSGATIANLRKVPAKADTPKTKAATTKKEDA